VIGENRAWARSTAWAAALAVAVLLIDVGPLSPRVETITGHHDNATFNYPLRIEAARQWAEGRPPFWNPYNLAGAPLLADITSATLYPGNLPFLLGESTRYAALDRVALLHFSLAAVFMYVFARALRLGRPAAALAGLVYAGNGTLGFFASLWIQMQNAAVWLPLILAAVHRAGGRDRFWVWVLIGAAAVALQVLSGYPQYNFYTGVFACAWALMLAPGRSGMGWRPLAAVALIYAGGIALSAVQLLPAAELAALSRRSAAVPLTQFLNLSASPGFPAGLAVPGAMVAPTSYGIVRGGAFMGTIAVVLAVEGARGLGRIRIFLVAMLLTTFLLAIGSHTPLGEWTYRVPVLNAFRYPFKHLLEVMFCLAALAGLGAQSLLDRRKGATACVTAGALLAIWVLVRRLSTLWVASSAVAAAGTALFVLLVLRGRRREAIGVALIATWLGLAANRGPLMDWSSPDRQERELRAAVLEALAGRSPTPLGPRYVASLPSPLEPSLGLAYPTEFRVPAVHGTSPFLWRPLGEALHMTDNGTFLRPGIFIHPDEQVWDVLAARYFSARQPIATMGEPILRGKPDFVLHERTSALPPIRFVDGVKCMAPAEIAREVHRRKYDFARVALVDCEGRRRPPMVAPSRGRGVTTVVASEPGLLRLRTRLPRGAPGVLVISQADIPGWTARIDGRPAPIYRAYGLVQALVVPPGEHQVVLEYAPASFTLGATISVAALALSLGLAAVLVAASRGRRAEPSIHGHPA
jgi:hypothetical protein